MGGVTRRPLETKDLDNDCGRGDGGVLMPSTPSVYPQVVSVVSPRQIQCLRSSERIFAAGSNPGSSTENPAVRAKRSGQFLFPATSHQHPSVKVANHGLVQRHRRERCARPSMKSMASCARCSRRGEVAVFRNLSTILSATSFRASASGLSVSLSAIRRRWAWRTGSNSRLAEPGRQHAVRGDRLGIGCGA
jgi:hypothetical protein